LDFYFQKHPLPILGRDRRYKPRVSYASQHVDPLLIEYKKTEEQMQLETVVESVEETKSSDHLSSVSTTCVTEEQVCPAASDKQQIREDTKLTPVYCVATDSKEFQKKLLLVVHSYADFFAHISFRKGWAKPSFEYYDVFHLFVRAAYVVVRIRLHLDSMTSGIKIRQLDGSARDWMWTVTENPASDAMKEEQFIRNLIHKTLCDAKGYVEGLSAEIVDKYIDELINENPTLVEEITRAEKNSFFGSSSLPIKHWFGFID